MKTVAFGFNARYDGAVALCRASGQYPRLYQFGTGSAESPDVYAGDMKTCSAYRERAEHTRLRRDADGLYTVTKSRF